MSPGVSYKPHLLAYLPKPITFVVETASAGMSQLQLLLSSVIPIVLSDLLSSGSIQKVAGEKAGVTDNEASKRDKAGMKSSQL